VIQGKNKFSPQKNSWKPQNSWGGNAKKLTTRSVPATLAYRALALLLENRELLAMLGDTALWNIADTPGMELLCASIAVLKNAPTLSIDELQSQLPADLAKQINSIELKSIANSVPKAGVTQEFQGALQRLCERSQEQAMEILLTKATTGILSQEEKVHLRDLLDDKEKNRSE
jgi:hypothetical protein